MIDPIVEEIRKFRDAHAKHFNYDLDAICEDLKSHQQTCGHRLVKFPPKKIASNSLNRKGTATNEKETTSQSA